MKKWGFGLTFLLLLVGGVVCADNNQSWWNTDYNTTEGTDFWVTFMTNSGAYNSDQNDLTLYLYVTSRENAKVAIENPNKNGSRTAYTVNAGEQERIQITDLRMAYLTDNDTISQKGVHITSDKPISVYATSHHNSGKYDGTNILPTEALVGEYVVQTYTSDQYSTEFALIAIENNTQITGEIKRTDANGNDTIIPFQQTLQSGETYLYRSAATTRDGKSGLPISLSGSHFCSEKPFALFQGGQSAKIPKEPENHIFHQAYPTAMWGKTFVVTPTHYAVYDYVQITAAEDGTQIMRDGLIVKTINAFETYIDTIKSDKRIIDVDNWIETYSPVVAIYTTSKAVTCFLYGTGKEVNGSFISKNQQAQYDLGSPVLTAIVPQEYGMRSCIFATFDKIISGNEATMNHYVNIVTRTDEVSGMYMDNQSIASDFTQCSTNSAYSYAIKNVSAAAHLLENRNETTNSIFTARVYGLGKTSSTAESYAYAAGCRISRSADLLVNHIYTKDEDICITDEAVVFTPIINYDFVQYKLEYTHRPGTTTTANSGWQTDLHNIEKQFPDTGLWETDLVVQRKTPICDYSFYDTVRVHVYVHDTIRLDYGYNEGSTPNICYGEEFDVHYNRGQHFHYKADTTTLQEIEGTKSRFTLNKTYTFIDTLSTQWGCDSIIRQSVCIRPTYYKLIYDTICHKDAPYTYIDPVTGRSNTGKLSNLYSSGHYVDSLLTQYGCDSVLDLYLIVNPDYKVDTTTQICSNQDFYWQGHHYVGENYYGIQPTDIVVPAGAHHKDSLHFWTSDAFHCDSILTFHLSVVDTFIVSLTYSTCVHVPIEVDFDTDKFPDYTVNSVGQQVYVDSLLSQAGCDSIVTLTLNVLPRYDLIATDTVCQNPNGIYDWNGHTHLFDSIQGVVVPHIRLEKAGWHTYVDSLQTKVGNCDSIWTLRLYVAPIYTKTETRTICDNDSVHWRGHVFVGNKASQTYRDEATFVLAGGMHIGADTAYYATMLGCDSIYTLNLQVDTTTITRLTYHHCTSEKTVEYEQTLFDISYVQTIDTTFHYSTAYHCDSAVVYHIVVDSAYYFAEYDTVCQNSQYEWTNHSKRVSVSTAKSGDFTYEDNLRTIAGCDSVYTLHLTIHPVYRIDEGAKHFCDDDTLRWQGRLYAGAHAAESVRQMADAVLSYKAGGYRDSVRYTSQYGCDSLRYVTLLVDTTTITRLTYHHCTSEKTVEYEQTLFDISYVQTIDTTFHYSTAYHCDSAVVYHIVVDSAYYFAEYDTVCQNSQYEWTNHSKRVSVSTAKSGDFTYEDNLRTIAGCDSVYTLYLRINPIYWTEDTLTMSDEESCKWEHTIYVGSKVHIDTLSMQWYEPEWSLGMARPNVIVIPAGQIKNHFDTIYPTVNNCDSTRALYLLVGPTYRDTIVRWTCDNEPYHWYHSDADVAMGNEARTDLTIMAPQLYYDSLKTKEFGFDSIYVLDLHNYPTYRFSKQDTVCQGVSYIWDGHTESAQLYSVQAHRWIDSDKIPTIVPGRYMYIDSLKTKEPPTHIDQTLNHGCDSVWTLELLVPPSYYYDTVLTICDNDTVSWQNILFVGNKFEKFHHTYDATLYDSVKVYAAADIDNVGTYHDTVYFTTAGFDCDSVYRAEIRISPSFYTEQEREVCQYDDVLYEAMGNGIGGKVPTDAAITLEYYDTIASLRPNACDSVIRMTYHIWPVYSFVQHDTICQDTISPHYVWEDEFGGDHSGVSISIARPGDYTYTDTLRTIHGCDSIFGLHLHVSPIYRFDSLYTICDNESVTWQGQRYVGYKFADIISTDIVVRPGLSRDTAYYLTQENCDSTYYLELHIHPTFDTLTYTHICRNENFDWKQIDHNGYYTDHLWDECNIDTIRISTDMASVPLPQFYREADTIRTERMLHTVFDCDSLSRIELIVHPVYFFYSDTAICSSEKILWRGRYFSSHDTVCTDYISTDYGCDSIYQLRLHIYPSYLFNMMYDLCDNETLYHNNNHIDVVWAPGNPIVDYTELYYYTEAGCDSVYRYYLNIHPTYYAEDSTTLCSNEDYTFHIDTIINLHREYNTHTMVTPFDTIFIDSLSTIYGCDSVFHLKIHVLPAYHYIDYDTICDNGSVLWRGQTIQSLTAGDHIYWDSLTTKAGCDSVYELRLRVLPTYFYESRESICADETYDFNGRILNKSGFYSDSLVTIYGCDSVYHLFLTVLDTTYEVRVDTICYGETYMLHDTPITQGGFYKDTTQNEWGCHHFTYLSLSFTEPTIAHLLADSVCMDRDAFELGYWYEGTAPIAYSLLFNDFGHEQGFEDQHYIAFDTDSMVLLPMPQRTLDDPTQYPRPDHYLVTLVLHNGLCLNDSMYPSKADIIMNYPSWVTEQRFRDVIAILDTKYNGGYEFTTFQWFCNGQPMPGETHEYLYLPHEMIVDTVDYYVRLTRPGELESFQTCPIRIYPDAVDTLAPNLPYISVVPTYVSREHPVVNILSINRGHYKVFTSTGSLFKSGEIIPDEHHAMEVELDPTQGNLFMFYLCDDETIYSEKERVIKVTVQ